MRIGQNEMREMEDVNLGIAKREEIMSLGGDSKIGEKEPPL